jgi:hypothetical protein
MRQTNLTNEPADYLARRDQLRLAEIELFSGPGRSLVVYHLMYGKHQTSPCPICTMWIDRFNGVASHLAQNVDVAIAAAADPPALRARPPPRLAQPAAAQLRGQQLQVRPRQRGRPGQPGLGHLGLHPRRPGHPAALLHQGWSDYLSR